MTRLLSAAVMLSLLAVRASAADGPNGAAGVAAAPASIDAPRGTLWLESLEPIRAADQGPAAADRAFPNHAICLGGKTYRHGLWSHDRDSAYNVALHGKAVRLSLMAGLADSNGKHGHLRFFITGDGRTLADTGFMRGGDEPRLLSVPLDGIDRLTVRVDTGGDGNWANAAMGGALLEVQPDEYLHAAAFSGRMAEVANAGKLDAARRDAVDGLLGTTSYGAACLGGQVEIARLLAQGGADRNWADSDKNTILHLAATRGNGAAVWAAAAAGTDLRLRNSRGLTAHEVALANGDITVLARLSEAELWLEPLDSPSAAPAFTVTDLDGQRVTLASFRNRTVVLFFYTDMPWDKSFNYTWLDYAQRLSDSPEAKKGDLAVLVATPAEPAAARAFLEPRGYTFRTLSDPKDTIRRALGLYAMPAVVIGPNGRIVWQRRMWQRLEAEDSGLSVAVSRVLAGQPKYRTTGAQSTTQPARGEEVLFDFEGGFAGWTTTGRCWERVPATDAFYPGLIKGYVGRSFLSTFGPQGTTATGMAVSPAFTIKRPYLHLLVGGGDLPDHCAVTLVCNGLAVRRAAGRNTAELDPVCWDVRDLVGKEAHLEVYDAGTIEPRDFVLLDQVVASDSSSAPASYSRRFDPDDPACRDLVAAATPATYKALQGGAFHVASRPGRTYHLEMERPIRWPDGETDWLQYIWEPPPSHFVQTVQSVSMTVEASGRTYEPTRANTGRPLMSQALVCDIPAARVPDRRGKARFSCDITINSLQLMEGRSPDHASLPAELRRGYTASYSGYPYADPWMKQYMTRHRLWRLPEETDAAYLLRAYRFFQRSFSYANSQWGGWPTSQPWGMDSFDRLTADCGLAIPMAMLLRANGIPALEGQGCWVGDGGEGVGPHVRMLALLKDAGWIWLDVGPEVQGISEPITIGKRWDDNFMSDWLNDIPAESKIPRPAGGKALRGWQDGGDWWRSWVKSKP